jgi:hypothetical protein
MKRALPLIREWGFRRWLLGHWRNHQTLRQNRRFIVEAKAAQTTPMKLPFPRPYAPDATYYPNPQLIPVPPLNAAQVAHYNLVTVHHEPNVATICDLILEKAPPRLPTFYVAEYRIVRNPDNSIEWFKFVPMLAFRVWLRFQDDSRDDSKNLSEPMFLFGRCPDEVECLACGCIFSPEVIDTNICPDCGVVSALELPISDRL